MKLDYSVDLSLLVKCVETYWIEQALLLHGGNKTGAARFLRMNRTTLIEKMRRYRIGERYENGHVDRDQGETVGRE